MSCVFYAKNSEMTRKKNCQWVLLTQGNLVPFPTCCFSQNSFILFINHKDSIFNLIFNVFIMHNHFLLQLEAKI